jgi:cytochrome c oxidase subunit III
MPVATMVEDIELVIEDIRDIGNEGPPPGGDDGEGDKRPGPRMPSSRRHATAIILGMVAIVMLFMAMSSAFIALRATSDQWVSIRIPGIIWFNTAVLLFSSGLVEWARRRLALADVNRFRTLWFGATALGLVFLVGQLVAWRQLVSQGVYMADNQASSFFYLFTGLHGLHLFGGVAALLYVSFRKFERATVPLSTAAEVTSYYWHFMDGLWLFLVTVLYLGR